MPKNPEDKSATITFSVKELLTKLDRRMDELFSVIHTKASEHELRLVIERLEIVERQGCPMIRQLIQGPESIVERINNLEKSVNTMAAVADAVQKVTDAQSRDRTRLRGLQWIVGVGAVGVIVDLTMGILQYLHSLPLKP